MPPRPVVRFVANNATTPLAIGPNTPDLAISPDGTRIAYTTSVGDLNSLYLYVRPLDQLDGTPGVALRHGVVCLARDSQRPRARRPGGSDADPLCEWQQLAGTRHHKTGNRYVRAVAIELAWGWLRYQPDSALSQWFTRRFAEGSSRQRRIGIVAVARKLLVSLWRFLEQGVLREGAVLKPMRIR